MIIERHPEFMRMNDKLFDGREKGIRGRTISEKNH